MNNQVKQYIENIPADRNERFNALYSLVMKLYSGANVDMQYKMPDYKVGDGWVALANQHWPIRKIIFRYIPAAIAILDHLMRNIRALKPVKAALISGTVTSCR